MNLPRVSFTYNTQTAVEVLGTINLLFLVVAELQDPFLMQLAVVTAGYRRLQTRLTQIGPVHPLCA